MKLDSLMNQIPPGVILSTVAVIFLSLGLALARKLWGKNSSRLKAALDDSAYLAGQWATLGISQSQLVEKLGKKVSEGAGESGKKELALRAELKEREKALERLEQQIKKMEESRSVLSEREVEALQLQVEEIQKRDSRIQTLENRIQHLDQQNAQNVAEHKKQVQVLLDRISAMEESGAVSPDADIQENNKQLTGLLKQRCSELEQLRDEFHNKEKALTKLREQNAVLKKGVDDLVARWSRKKGEVAELGELKARLAQTTEELSKVKRDFEMREVEIDLLQKESKLPSDIPADLAAAKFENDEVKEELSRTSAQVDMLLDVIESRDRKVEELEAQLSSGSKNQQIQALSQTIADLQQKVNQSNEELAKTREETRSLKDQLEQHKNDLDARDIELTILRSKTEDGDLDFDIASLDGSTKDNRVITEAKGLGRTPTKFSSGGKSMIYFGENSAFIKSESLELIKEIAREVRDTGCQISVLGYAEKEGSESFNETLSKRRAEAVKDRFEEEGVDSSNLIVKGKGEDPEMSGTPDSWKARRVEIVVLPVAEIVN